MTDPPEGFLRHSRTSPYLDLIGPLWSRGHGSNLEFALRVDGRHLNNRGSLHGGVIAALADVALGYATAATTDPPTALTTVTLAISYLGAVPDGSLVTVRTDIDHVGRRLAHATARLVVGERLIARAHASFAVGP